LVEFLILELYYGMKILEINQGKCLGEERG
jgi:hypothetical protein